MRTKLFSISLAILIVSSTNAMASWPVEVDDEPSNSMEEANRLIAPEVKATRFEIAVDAITGVLKSTDIEEVRIMLLDQTGYPTGPSCPWVIIGGTGKKKKKIWNHLNKFYSNETEKEENDYLYTVSSYYEGFLLDSEFKSVMIEKTDNDSIFALVKQLPGHKKHEVFFTHFNDGRCDYEILLEVISPNKVKTGQSLAIQREIEQRFRTIWSK